MTDRFENPKSVSLTTNRWTATIKIVDQDDKEHIYYASADSGITYGDGLWFGTKEDYDEIEMY